MSRFEIAAIVSSVWASVSLTAMLFFALVYAFTPGSTVPGPDGKPNLLYWANWDRTGLGWVLAAYCLAGLLSSIAAAWSSGQRRRELEADAAAPGGAGIGSRWGADAQEAALSEERTRLTVVRRMVEPWLAYGSAVLLFAAAAWCVFVLASDVVLNTADELADWIFRASRAFSDHKTPGGLPAETFPTLASRYFLFGGACFVFALVSWAYSVGVKRTFSGPGSAAVLADAAMHQTRTFAFLLAGGALLAETTQHLPEDHWFRTLRWLCMAPAALWLWRGGAGLPAALLLPLLAVVDDVVLADIAGREAGDSSWGRAAAVLLLGLLLWQAVEFLWNGWSRRSNPEEGGFLPLPAAGSQFFPAVAEGRFLPWLGEGLQANFGAEIGVDAARSFLIGKVGGTVAAGLVLFYLSTAIVTVQPWEVGVRERYGMPVTEVVTTLVNVTTQERVSGVHRVETTVHDGTKWVVVHGFQPGVPPMVLAESEITRRGWAVADRELPVILPAGLHFKLPWPAERVLPIPVARREQTLFGSPSHDHGDFQTWSSDHFANEFEILTGDKMLASVIAVMHWHVRDPVEYFRHVYPETAEDRNFSDQHADGAQIKKTAEDSYQERRQQQSGPRHGARPLIAQVGYRAVTEIACTNSIWHLMAENRGPVGRPDSPDGTDLESQIRAAAQGRLDRLRSGIQVNRVQLVDVHPPVSEGVGEHFEIILGYLEERERTINEAHQGVARDLTKARVEAGSKLSAATAENIEITTRSIGKADHYGKIAEARAGLSAPLKGAVDYRLMSRARLRMLPDATVYVLPPDLDVRLRMEPESSLQDVIAPPPPGTSAGPSR